MYKRQIPTEPQSHAHSSYTTGITIQGALKSATFYTNSTEGAVSYTHLDVYKRQALANTIFKLYRAGRSYEEIARSLGVSIEQIRELLD